MSSRALRRVQRELEEKQIQEKLAQGEQEDEEEESEEEVAPKPKAKASLFAMLDDGGDDQEDEEEDDDEEQEPQEPRRKTETEPVSASKSKKNKKKKKKKKGKSGSPPADPSPTNTSSGLDEIDQALMALNLTADGQASTNTDQHSAAVSEEMKQLCAALSIESQHLHAANEMKKLFGRAALQNNDDEPQPRPRQRGHGQQGGIAAAVAGRNGPGAHNLASLGLRRNIFIQGKEEWPRATSGGLGMEVVEKRPDGTVEYRFVHNRTYQEVQQQFQACVGSMDPERMVQLLHHNRKRWSPRSVTAI
jgi:hypothetical protein